MLMKIGTWIEWFIGGYDGLFYALFVFIIINFITNIMRGVLDKQWRSCVSMKVIFKKVLIFIFVGIGNILDTQVIELGTAIRIIIILFYLSHEGTSIINNASYIGLPIPAKLKLILEQLQNKNKP